MTINDGGPAFPDDGQHNYTGGMSLRDYFAIHVPHDSLYIPESIGDCARLIGILATDYQTSRHWNMVVSKARYKYADAMIAARDRKE